METKKFVEILTCYEFSQLGIRMFTMKFPNGFKPSVGMTLRGTDGEEWTLHGIVFDVNRGKDVYDCSVIDKQGILNEGAVL
jgi:hypothetical protein